jgi:serine/threonine-protein kinase RsbW
LLENIYNLANPVQKIRQSPINNDRSLKLQVDPESSPAHFDVTLPADVNSISPVVAWVMRLVRELENAPAKEFEIELALREALANAVKHGCNGDPAQKVELSVADEGERGILLVVRDPGRGFDPTALPCPTDEENLYADHGRGIYMINKLMDEVKYEHNGSEIHMRKYR